MADSLLQIKFKASVEMGRVVSTSSKEPQLSAHSGQRSCARLLLRSSFHGAQLALSCSQHFPNVSKSMNRHHDCNVQSRSADNDCFRSGEGWAADSTWRMTKAYKQLNKAAGSTNEGAQLSISSPSQDASDWRHYRARLCSSELPYATERQIGDYNSALPLAEDSSHWAHRISSPEAGCLLVATDKLKHHAFFRDAVIILLELTDKSCSGITLNKSIPFSAFALQGANQRVLLDLPGYPKYIGGPFLSNSSHTHVLTRRSNLRGFRTVMPGLALGEDAALPTLVSGLNSQKICQHDVKLFIGQIEWRLRHLFAEITALGWWDVVSCSSNLIFDSAPDEIWQRVQSACGERHAGKPL